MIFRAVAMKSKVVEVWARTEVSEGLYRLLGKDVGSPAQNRSMFPQYLLLGTLAIALPLAILFSVQVWMATVYTGALDPGAFAAQYYQGVYRYRIVGRDLLIEVYNFLSAHFVDRPYPLPRDQSASFLFYSAYVVSNGIYFGLSNVLLLSLLWVKKEGLPDRELALYIYYTLLLAMSMAVVTPYDQLAYLLLLVGILGTRAKSPSLGILLVAVSAVAGMLNRETEFLLASFLATMALFSPKPLAKRYVLYLLVDVVLSVGVYAGVRLLTPGNLQVIQAITYGGKWALQSVVVIGFLLASVIVIAMRLYANVRPALIFLLLSLPYGLAIVMGGDIRELRLVVPVVLSVLCLYVFLGRENGELARASSAKSKSSEYDFAMNASARYASKHMQATLTTRSLLEHLQSPTQERVECRSATEP
jgi:hypothetical protein